MHDGTDKSTSQLMAEITIFLEDAHNLSVNGQSADMPTEELRQLAHELKRSAQDICTLASSIQERISGDL